MRVDAVVSFVDMAAVVNAVAGQLLLAHGSPVGEGIIAVEHAGLFGQRIVQQHKMAPAGVRAAYVYNRIISGIDIEPQLRVIRIPVAQVFQVLAA